MLTFAAYELAINPDIQAKLYDEIKKTNEKLNGQRITFDIIQKIKYLDQVVSESLRKWPPAVLTGRVCNKDFTFEDSTSLRFRIKKGCQVWIPIYGLHHDPLYFVNPDKFDPERFSDERRKDIVNGTYVPFGIGPRNCIGKKNLHKLLFRNLIAFFAGSRLALMEIKAVLYNLVLNFIIEPNKHATIPITVKKTPVGLAAKDDFPVDLIPRNRN